MLKSRIIINKAAGKIMFIITILGSILIILIIAGLFYKSRSLLFNKPLSQLLFGSSWYPLRGEFGLFPFIIGTLYVTIISLIFAVPLCLLTSIFLSEYSDKKIQKVISSLIDLFAGIPSVVYGIWGILIVVPLIKKFIAPFFKTTSTGYCLLSGGIVLAIMIFPIIIQISVEVLKSVPKEARESSMALGATKWQTIKFVVIRKAIPGIFAAIILGLSRALGETMAVLMVVGNVAKIPNSLFKPAYPLTALIANNYGEMLSVPLYDSALMFAALILLIIVLLFNIIARAFLIKIERNIQ